MVKVGEETTAEFWTKKGVRQGCCLSPTLFSIYISELETSQTLLRTVETGMRVGKRRFCSLVYADDLIAVAKTEEDCKLMMRKLEAYLDEKELFLNVAKTKLMVFGKGRGKEKRMAAKRKGELVETVKEFTYLGMRFQRNGE